MIRFAAKPPQSRILPMMRSLAERMASDMNELAFAGDNVNVEKLVERGYTPQVIKRIAPEAVQIARRNAIRQVGCL